MEPWLLRLLGWIKSNHHRFEIMVCLARPMLYCELMDMLRVKRNNRLKELKELCERKMVECLTPFERKGRLYGLTSFGRRVRRNLVDSLTTDEKSELEQRLGIRSMEQYQHTRDIKDWDLYAIIAVSRKQMKPLMEILSEHEKSIRQIDYEYRQKTGKHLSSGTLNAFLRKLARLGVASRTENRRNVFYRATQKGMAIKKHLLA